MNREEALLQMLESTAKIQQHISEILDAKAVEAEKSRNWICSHAKESCFAEYAHQLKHSMDIHEQMIEVIDAMTKMENSLARNLKTILNRNEGSGSGGMSPFGSMFDLDGGSSS